MMMMVQMDLSHVDTSLVGGTLGITMKIHVEIPMQLQSPTKRITKQ